MPVPLEIALYRHTSYYGLTKAHIKVDLNSRHLVPNPNSNFVNVAAPNLSQMYMHASYLARVLVDTSHHAYFTPVDKCRQSLIRDIDN